MKSKLMLLPTESPKSKHINQGMLDVWKLLIVVTLVLSAWSLYNSTNIEVGLRGEDGTSVRALTDLQFVKNKLDLTTEQISLVNIDLKIAKHNLPNVSHATDVYTKAKRIAADAVANADRRGAEAEQDAARAADIGIKTINRVEVTKATQALTKTRQARNAAASDVVNDAVNDAGVAAVAGASDAAAAAVSVSNDVNYLFNHTTLLTKSANKLVPLINEILKKENTILDIDEEKRKMKDDMKSLQESLEDEMSNSGTSSGQKNVKGGKIQELMMTIKRKDNDIRQLDTTLKSLRIELNTLNGKKDEFWETLISQKENVRTLRNNIQRHSERLVTILDKTLDDAEMVYDAVNAAYAFVTKESYDEFVKLIFEKELLEKSQDAAMRAVDAEKDAANVEKVAAEAATDVATLKERQEVIDKLTSKLTFLEKKQSQEEEMIENILEQSSPLGSKENMTAG
jgi:hypothetical protein